MEEHIVKILDIQPVTHDVRRYRVEKPAGYSFMPGQATDVCIADPKWINELRSFTFTALNHWDFLEFTIKSYKDHDGVTNALYQLEPGEHLVIHDVWGAIHYEAPGVFIAGGAGVTPFIAILRDLQDKKLLDGNKLIFANKTSQDILLKDEFTSMLGNNFINVLSNEEVESFHHGFINEELLKKYIIKDDYVYLCGPPPMMDAVQAMLKNLGLDENKLVVEL